MGMAWKSLPAIGVLWPREGEAELLMAGSVSHWNEGGEGDCKKRSLPLLERLLKYHR